MKGTQAVTCRETDGQ